MLGKEHEPTCILIQTRHDMHLLVFIGMTNIVSLNKVCHSIGMINTGNTGHPCRFIQNQEMLILVDDRQVLINSFQTLKSFFRRNVNRHFIANIQEINSVLRLMVDKNVSAGKFYLSQEAFGNFMSLQKGLYLDMFISNKLKPHSWHSPIKESLTRFQKLVWLGEATKCIL